MRVRELVIVFTAMAGAAISQGATLITSSSGLIVDTFPASLSGQTFTDAMGNSLRA